MIRNHLKIALRTLSRRKGHTIINIGGLAVGIAVCLIIFLVIRFELSFDDYHQKKERIYRVMTEFHHADVPEPFTSKGVPFAVPATLQTDLPQLEAVSAIYKVNGPQLMVLDPSGGMRNKFKEEDGVFFTQPAIFDIFDVEWLDGDKSGLLQPNAVVLSRETAIKYFGQWEEAMGRQLKLNDEDLLEVVGIIADVPRNTDLQFRVIISYGTGFTRQLANSDDWDSVNGNFGCFVLFPPSLDASTVGAQLRALAKEHKADDNEDSLVLQSLDKIHLDTESGTFSNMAISMTMINVLWLVAGFILLIACVNFVNLVTAQTLVRNKEIGVRKVLGAGKIQLKAQFFTETLLIVFCAICLSVFMTYFSLEYVGGLLGLPLSPYMIFSPDVCWFLLSLLIGVTLLAGFYPSVVLSNFSPTESFKNQLSGVASGGISLRRVLVVFQFVVAQVLIIATLVIVNQMDYFMKRPLGFEKEAVLNIPVPRDSISLTKLEYLGNELEQVNGIKEVSFSSTSPSEDSNNWTRFIFDHASEDTDFYSICKGIDHNFLPAYGLTLTAGRNIRQNGETTEFLVNQTLVKSLGYANPEDILNKEIDLWEGEFVGPVVGVIKDFHERSFRDGIAPVIMVNAPDWYGLAGIKFVPAQAQQILQSIETIWNRTYPNQVFEYEFLDTKIANYYEQEQRLSKMYKLSAALAIFLSCLGLYGLASFLILKRIKEAGIRKVLGATVQQIVYLFSREFIILIGIAFLIASPISWYFMKIWLEGYEYHTDISIWLFLLGGLTTMFIALSSISYQAIRAALSNPVKSLSTE